MSDYFNELVDLLRENHLTVDPPYLHGLLTGFATTPDPDLAKLYMEISGEQPLSQSLREEVLNVADFLSEDLSLHEFKALFQVDHNSKPEWMHFDNPWRFYDPIEIQRRQQRWLKEDREQEQERFNLDNWRPVKTYVREQPKIGRNDLCPCGSGKKYKKCCMNNLH